ncbi:MAG: hypothetical protein Ct9H300mP7_1180 [Verrucomicrobiota bacterium]|nr:MAG: hypothetical protein Ct9H300mP7_1180 [Verrucomicrobiota bacterium]
MLLAAAAKLFASTWRAWLTATMARTGRGCLRASGTGSPGQARPEGRRHHLAFRHDGRAGRISAQRLKLLGHRGGGYGIRLHLQRAGLDAFKVPSPLSPSFIALDAKTGELKGEDDAGIGPNIYHGQWSSPSYGSGNGQGQLFLVVATAGATPSIRNQFTTKTRIWIS